MGHLRPIKIIMHRMWIGGQNMAQTHGWKAGIGVVKRCLRPWRMGGLCFAVDGRELMSQPAWSRWLMINLGTSKSCRLHFLKALDLLSTYTTWVVTACSSGAGTLFSSHNWWHLASALWLRQNRVTVLPEWGHTFGIPSHILNHSHSHYAGCSCIEGGNNSFSSFLYSLKWLRNRGLSDRVQNNDFITGAS